MNEHEQPTFGATLRAVRLRRGMSMEGVAKASIPDYEQEKQVTRFLITRLERDLNPDPHLSSLLGLALALRIKIVIDPDGIEVIEIEEGS